jgi:polyisoprenoid-binding protein YceI
MDKRNLSTTFRTVIALLIAFVLIPSVNVFAQDTYNISKDSEMEVLGTSNIHDWEAEVKKIEGNIQMMDDMVQSVSVSIPVKSLDSGKGGMNSNMYKALKADKHENIMFELESAEMVSGDPASEMMLSAKGNLTIAGKTNPITMEVKATKSDSGYTFTGKQVVNMTDYGVEPPTAMFGTIATGEEVTIEFNLHTEATATH